MERLGTLLGVLGLALGPANAADVHPAPPLPIASPASQGLSQARLDRLSHFMQHETDAGDYLGAVTLIARNGKIVDWRTFGFRDVAKTSPMDPNAIFRIYSMTKTLASVAVLMLMEEGKLTLEDPIAAHLTEFADLQVFVDGTAEAPRLRPAVRPITIRHLLTHTAGFAAAGKDPAPVVQLLERATLQTSADHKTFSERLSRVPLGADPGTRFSYDGVATEVLGRLVQVVSGMAFDEFLQRRLLTPLALRATGFSVPEAQRDRIVEMSSTDADGRLVASPAYADRRPGEPINPYPSAAGGLYSTAADYARFCQMLLNGGELDGASILGRKSVELMMLNHLTHLDPPVNEYGAAEGFGLGGYVVLDVARRGRPGSVGQFGWSGAASTYYTIDREERLIAILMMQHLPQGLARDPPKLSVQFYNLVYQSLVK